MTATLALADRLARLERTVATLQQQQPGSEALQPNIFTIDAAGNVGVVLAGGITVPATTADPPVETTAITFTRSDGSVAGRIFDKLLAGAGNSLLTLEADTPSPNFASVGLRAVGAATQSVVGIDSLGNSSFLQLLSAQKLQLPYIAPSGDSSGATDAANIANAISTLGYARLIQGVYYVNSTISADNSQNVSVIGAGSIHGGTVINVVAGNGISAQNSYGFTLRGLQLENDQASFSGSLVDLTGATLAEITSNRLGLASGVPGIQIRLQNAASCHILRNYFTGGEDAIQGLFTGTDFSNAHVIERNWFGGQVSAPIVGLGYGCAIIGNVFEPQANGNARAYFQSASLPCRGLLIAGNYMGDANTSGAWLTIAGTGITIVGNLIWDGSTAFLTSGNCDGLTIMGNSLNAMGHGLDPSTGAHTRVIYLGNGLASVTTSLAVTTTLGSGSVVDNNGALIAKGGIASF